MVRTAAWNLDKASRPVPNKGSQRSINVTMNKAHFKSFRELEDEFFDHAAFRGRPTKEPNSPQNIKLSEEHKSVLKSIKMQRKEQLDLATRDLLIELCQYYSAYCKYTGNSEFVNSLLFNFERGMINLVALKNELKDVKAKYV